MSWRVCLGDTMTGLLAQSIDVPGFTWSVSVSDSTFSTGRDKDKGVGEDSAGGLNLPWSAIPADDPSERCHMLMPLKRSVCLIWDDGSREFPVAWGAIGPRTDTYTETSFDLISAMELLDSRLLVREGAFGAVSGMTDVSVPDEWDPNSEGGYREGATVQHDGHEWESLVDDNSEEPGHGDKWEDLGPVVGPQPATFTRDAVSFSGMSLRGIASEVGTLCTSRKPSGQLPIDWTYAGEGGGHERTYDGFDVGNNSCADVLRKLANVIDGPDIQFRPYLADETHVRLRLVAGSDSDVFIGQSATHEFAFMPHGGNAENVKVDYANPVMRVYATGSGTDEAKLCCLSEDMTLCSMTDPWPLMEYHYNDSDADSAQILRGHADAELEATSRPLMQVSFDVHFNDPSVPPPGSMWPGEMVVLHVSGFPSLPDGPYRMRLMEMSGDDTDKATLLCRPLEAPIY